MGILTRVTDTDLPIHTLMVMILDNDSLITPELVRVFAPQGGLYHRHSYLDDRYGSSHPYRDGHDLG